MAMGRITRLATGEAGEVSEVCIARPFGIKSSVVAACRDDDKRLRLITWELSNDGRQINRLGGALAGSASHIRIAGTSDQGRHFLVTGCADAAGNLKLINWEANL